MVAPRGALGGPGAHGRRIELLLRDPATTVEALVAEAGALRQQRAFPELLALADAGVRRPGGEVLWPFVVQALVELDASAAASLVLDTVLGNGVQLDDGTRAELAGQRGRVAKQRWLDTEDPAALRLAVDAYLDAAAVVGADPLWAPINAAALAAAAERLGVDLEGRPTPAPSGLLAIAATQPLPRTAWSLATEIEARVLCGQRTGLDVLTAQLLTAPGGGGFVAASLARQLVEVHGFDPADDLVLALGQLALASGQGEVLLPRDPAGFERAFDGVRPVNLEVYRRGLECSRSVGHLLVGGTYGHATAFVMRGADLHPSLGDRPVLVTNEHAVTDPSRPNDDRRLLAHEVQARFEALPGPEGAPLVVDDLRAVWHSAREELDVTVMVVDGRHADELPPLQPASRLPEVRTDAHVYVIGHPGQGPLQLSIRGNELIDRDDRRLHYRAPTERGSSGSPVLDEQWQLVGVHHYGSNRLRALTSDDIRPANQGSTIAAVRAEMAERPPRP